MDQQTQTELEAAAFRGLVHYLRKRTDVQNIDLMITAGFCRNCMAKWYMKAAGEKAIDMSYDEAREAIYGMPYSEWKDRFQTETTPQKRESFAKAEKAFD